MMKVKIIKEVYSEKQRRFFCASDDPKLKAKCDDPIKKEVISETIDKDYLKQQGIILLKKLGEGMFGIVYEIITDVGDGDKRYALKYVSDQSQGYARERKNYQAVKKFVELGNIRQDAEAQKLGKILPIIYSVSEHGGGLYIIMEKLIPLDSSEEKLFMSEISGLAYHYSMKGQEGRGFQLIDYITDRDGDVGMTFGVDMATAIVKAVMRAPEYKHVKKNPQAYVKNILRGGKSYMTTEVMKIWEDSSMVDDIKYLAIDELYKLNKDFNKFLNGVSTLLVDEYRGDFGEEEGAFLGDDHEFVAMLMGALFDTIFSQKYPMKYTKSGEHASSYETGHGESSEIWDADVQPNPKLKEQKKQYDTSGVTANPKQQAPDKTKPQKYPFDAIISAIRRLGRDWNIQAKDMHNANVMKRADGQFVIADIGLFNTKVMQSMQSGIFESKRRIKVKII